MIHREGPIGPVPCQEDRDRRQERLTHCWMGTTSLPMRPEQRAQRHEWVRSFRDTPLAWLDASSQQRVPMATAGEPLLVVLGGTLSEHALAALHDAAARNARVYVLAAPGCEIPDLGQNTRVLVRRVRGLPGAAMLAKRGRDACMFLGPPGAPHPLWQLDLTPIQGQALFQVLLHLFWHEAEDEAWTGNGPLRFQTPGDRPFDVPLPRGDAAAHLIASSAIPPEALELWHAPDGALPARGQPAILAIPPSGAVQERLREVTMRGARIMYEATGLPFFTTDGRRGFLETSGAERRLRLALERTQAELLAQLMQQASEDAPWLFCTEPAVGDLSHQVWCAGAAAPAAPVECQEIQCDRITATTLRAVPETRPVSLPEPDPLACGVVWRWTVDPPRSPAKAKDDALVRAWRTCDERVAARVKEARARLEDMEHQSGSLGRSFAELAGPLLGFAQTRGELRREIESLGARTPSELGVDGADELFRELSTLEQNIAALDSRTKKAERKVREDRDREKQRKEWESRQADARDRLARVQEQQRATARALEQVQAGFAELPSIASRPDRKARSSKLRDEQSQLERAIKRLEGEEASLRRTLEEDFVPRAVAGVPVSARHVGGHAKFVPSASTAAGSQSDAPPSETLPGVGRLVASKGARYLVIERWDELERGEAEAERLGAVLAAPPETP